MRYIQFLFIILPLISCSFLQSPESYKIIEGEHCSIICDSSYSEEEYLDVLSLAELAFSEIKQLTGINLATSIPIYFKDYNFSNNAGYVLGEGIYLNPDFFYNDKEEQLHLIKHEMTHLFFSLYYGNTTSFLFSEGVAEYIAHDKSDGWDTSSLTDNLGEWIDFSYFNYRFNRDVYENIVSDLYSLSHQFVFFWCRTYGEESLFELYPVITAGNIIEKLEEYSNNTFREINNRFLDYSGVSP